MNEFGFSITGGYAFANPHVLFRLEDGVMAQAGLAWPRRKHVAPGAAFAQIGVVASKGNKMTAIHHKAMANGHTLHDVRNGSGLPVLLHGWPAIRNHWREPMRWIDHHKFGKKAESSPGVSK